MYININVDTDVTVIVTYQYIMFPFALYLHSYTRNDNIYIYHATFKMPKCFSQTLKLFKLMLGIMVQPWKMCLKDDW